MEANVKISLLRSLSLPLSLPPRPLSSGKHLYTLDAGNTIEALTFSPNRYWLCAAAGPNIKIWDLESKVVVDTLSTDPVGSKGQQPNVTSLAWSADGQTLFAGYTDHLIRVWQVL